MRRALDVAEGPHGEPAGHLRRPPPWRRAPPPGVDPARFRRHRSQQHVRLVEASRQREADRERDRPPPRRPAPCRRADIDQGRPRRWAGRTRSRRTRASSRTRSAPRTDGQPTASSCQRRPAPTQCTSACRVRPPDHERVVGVRHDVGVRRRRQCGPPAPGHHAHLVRAVQLVTRQVQQHHRRRRPRRHTRGRHTSSTSRTGSGTSRPGQRGHVNQVACWIRSRCSPRRRRGTRPTVSKRVVVVLPFVPVTSATCRPRSNARELRVQPSPTRRRRPSPPPPEPPRRPR